MQGLPRTDLHIPTEILVMVAPYLCKQDQLSARSLRLKPDGDSPSQFREIALSDTLRAYVKEVTIDTELDPDIQHCSERAEFDVCQNFLLFLPYLGLFNNLKHLHVRFSRNSDSQIDFVYEEWYFRYLVLDIISHCVTGMWTPANREKIYNTAPPEGRDSFGYFSNAPALRGDELQIKELTISHLADYNDPRLIHSKAWNELLQLPTLVDLKLLVGEDRMPNGTLLAVEKYDFFRTLPSKLLRPSVVQKLQVLSLFYTDYWGQYPKMDLQKLGDLPALKVLALGRYAFTNKKETDWIASLGKKNKSGGLEELYLDECCVLFQAKQYVDLKAVLGTIPDQNEAIETIEYSMRWHHVLSEWRVSMKGLKKFVMGVGDWGCPFRTQETWIQIETLTGDTADDPPEWVFGHNRHRFFANPEPENCRLPAAAYHFSRDRGFVAAYHSRRDKSREIPMGNYLLGEGLRQTRRAQMEYACYNVRCEDYHWFIINQLGIGEDSGGAPERETIELDNAAYALLMETIRDRLRS
ncbi:hypothetical protein FDENT_11653 [Fusarium denticulatum]|uniref:F-box domain-containing protein n=1 Tax=Fusarium denticulatum TaxID=48507 RepID=A0A8H5TGF2_9HYPO|nr:hypothetical protein FDENT_11653 [Fusarium denticulatum]